MPRALPNAPIPSFARAGVVAALMSAAASAAGQDLRLDVSSRLRYTDDAEGSDWDATFFSSLAVRDIIRDHLDFKLSGYGLFDLDGDDAFDNALEKTPVRISEAYVDLRNLGAIERARLGRQYLFEVDNLRFDGGTIHARLTEALTAFVFGGRPIAYYESASGDYYAGAGVIYEPTHRTRHQLDAYIAKENEATLTATAWRWNQLWTGNLRTRTRLRFLDSEVRDARIWISKRFEALGLGLDANLYYQPRTRGEGEEVAARTLSSLGAILGPRAAQYRIEANLSKTFGEHWLAQLGGAIRRKAGEGEPNTFNSVESDSGHFSITRFNAFVEGLDLTAGAESIHNELDEFWAVTGSASYSPNRAWRFTAGVTVSEYRFDPIDFATTLNGQPDLDILLEELQSVYYYARARWRPRPTYALFGEVGVDDSDEIDGSGLSVRFGFNYHFRRNLGEEGGA
jgi:hypothetical protein